MQAEQTKDGAHEPISYHVFKGVNYERLMSWKKGSGKIAMGVNEFTSQDTDEDTDDYRLPMWWSVVVHDTNFKLVKRIT